MDQNYELTADAVRELRQLISLGQHIGAVKRYREITGCGLAEGLAWLNAFLEQSIKELNSNSQGRKKQIP